MTPADTSPSRYVGSIKHLIVQALRDDLYRLAEPTSHDEDGNFDNTYASPGGIRVRVFGPNEWPSMQVWDSTGAMIADLPTASLVDLEAIL